MVEHAYRTFRDWPAWVTFALRSRVSQYPDRIEALWRTLIIDEHGIGKRASLEDGAGFESLISTENWTELAAWLHKRTSRHQKRKLIWTRRGFLGLECRHVQAGDKVCALWGGRLPFILREQEGSVVIKDGSAQKAHVLIGGELLCPWVGWWTGNRCSTTGGFECRRYLLCSLPSSRRNVRSALSVGLELAS